MSSWPLQHRRSSQFACSSALTCDCPQSTDGSTNYAENELYAGALPPSSMPACALLCQSLNTQRCFETEPAHLPGPDRRLCHAGFHLISQQMLTDLESNSCQNTVENFNESVPQSAYGSNSTAGPNGVCLSSASKGLSNCLQAAGAARILSLCATTHVLLPGPLISHSLCQQLCNDMRFCNAGSC